MDGIDIYKLPERLHDRAIRAWEEKDIDYLRAVMREHKLVPCGGCPLDWWTINSWVTYAVKKGIWKKKDQT